MSPPVGVRASEAARLRLTATCSPFSVCTLWPLIEQLNLGIINSFVELVDGGSYELRISKLEFTSFESKLS